MEEVKSPKVRQLNLRLSEEDLSKLDALAAERGVGKSLYIRDCIRDGDSYTRRRMDRLDRLAKVSLGLSGLILLALLFLIFWGC